MTRPIPSHVRDDGAVGQLTDDDRDTLARSPLFAGCSDDERARVHAFAQARHLAHGSFLLQPGEPNRHVYVLSEGQVAAFRDADMQTLVARFVPGDCVGEHALVGEEGGTVYVAAQWPSRLIALEATALREVMEQVPRIALNALDILSSRLRAANQRRTGEDRRGSLGFTATHDALTGLHNRRWMSEMFSSEIGRAAHDGESLCLLLLGVDHFDRFNQSLGRNAGDAILRQLADAIRNALPAVDMLARLAGDSFAALLPGPIDEAVAVCERLRTQIAARQFALRGAISTQLTVSIGLAPAAPDLDGALARAGEALARAKELGRNRVELAR